MEANLFAKLSKYPFTDGADFFSVDELTQNKTCQSKCKERDCLAKLQGLAHRQEYVCSHGYNCIAIKLGNLRVLLNGLIFEDNKKVPAGRREVRKEWVLREMDVMLFIGKMESVEKYLIDEIQHNTQNNFAIFHDFKTATDIIYACVQDLVHEQPGSDFLQKVENSRDSIRSLYESLGLITTQLGLMDVIVNPTSITYGNKRTMNLYKNFDRLTRLFDHIARKRHIILNLINSKGAYIRDIICYDSMELVPLILLDNAIKYSKPDTTIHVKLTQLPNRVKCVVENYGPTVSDGNTERIFEKFYRDPSAVGFNRKGIGMGLWIARQVLQAHASNVRYHKDVKETGGIGWNILEFEVNCPV